MLLKVQSCGCPFHTLNKSTCSVECLGITGRLWRFCNAIIRATMEKGSPVKALLTYSLLFSSGAFRPDERTLALVLKACTISCDHVCNVEEAHGRIIKYGFQRYGTLSSTLFKLYLSANRLADALPLLDEILHWDSNPFHGNLLIMCFSRKGELDKAYKVFKKMPVRDTVSWNSMIAAAVRSSRPKEALILQTRMMRSGVEPDCFSFSTTLSACARAGALSHGKRVHSLIKEKEVDYESNPILCSALIDMYSKCGEISMARRIFYNVKRLSISIWNSMISGLAMHGLGPDAVQVFKDMTKEGFFPDEITFVGILTACSHCGMLDEARFYFTAMQRDYCVKPQAEHYCAMVDAMARAGKVVDAYETIKAMPIEPDAAIWRALLGACRRLGRRDLAEMALGQMRQCGGEDYVLLSTMYCSVKQWGRAETMWREMKEKKLRKARGLSWFEMKGRVHQFKAGDRSHSEREHIFRILGELTRR